MKEYSYLAISDGLTLFYIKLKQVRAGMLHVKSGQNGASGSGRWTDGGMNGQTVHGR